MYILVSVFKIFLKIIYFFMKLFPLQDKIVMLSRETDSVNLDFRILAEELNECGIKTVIMCKKMGKGAKAYLSYLFHIFSQMYQLATSRVAIIDTYIIPVSILTHKKSLKVLQLWHGGLAIKRFGLQLSDKESSKAGLEGNKSAKMAKAMCMHKNYDAIMSASKANIPYFAAGFGYDESSFVTFGFPKMDYLIKNREEIKSKLYQKYPALSEKTNILYVPTFRKDRPVRMGELAALFTPDKYNFIVKLHPLDSADDFGADAITLSESSLELISIADYVISDYSSVVLEALCINKRILFYLYDAALYEKEVGMNINLLKDFPKIAFENAEPIYSIINQDIYDDSEAERFKSTYLDNSSGNSTELITKFITENWWRK